MLILGRKVGEKVMIGKDITVAVLAVQGAQIRLGIEAPTQIAVHREEVFDKIQKENEKQATETE